MCLVCRSLQHQDVQYPTATWGARLPVDIMTLSLMICSLYFLLRLVTRGNFNFTETVSAKSPSAFANFRLKGFLFKKLCSCVRWMCLANTLAFNRDRTKILTSQTHVPLPALPSRQVPWKLHVLPDQLGQAADRQTDRQLEIITI